MRLVAISDTHGMHASIAHVPQGDVLIHCGDIGDDASHYPEFIKWFAMKPHKHKIAIGGNHDFWLDPTMQRYRPEFVEEMKKAGIHYLCHDAVILDGLMFFGSPYVPNLNGWAFFDQSFDRYQNAPNCDILITHAPARGIRDGIGARAAYHCGSEHLLRYTMGNGNLQAHFFGHVHEGAGESWVPKGRYRALNAATCTRTYKPTNPPLVYDTA